MTTYPVLPSYGGHVLVASPNHGVRQRVLDNLRPRARRVGQASGGAEALVQLDNGSWQVLFLDRRLPDLDAEELSQTVRRRYPAVEVVLLDDDGAEAASAPDPSNPPQPAIFEEPNRAQAVLREGQSRNHVQALETPQEAEAFASLPGMIGDSAVMRPVYRMTHLVARRDTTVLITGPTGSGKELVARALHQLSPRASQTFAVVNCAAIPETLLEAELFGYSRGAFTGALQSYAGRIQAAHLGTLFLDEIGDMPLSLQPKLLRFLEQKELQRLGSSQVVRVDARVVAATHVDLLTLVREGKFREDLYYRLCAFPLPIPALSARPGDVTQLAKYFLDKYSESRPAPLLSDEAAAWLRAQSWPGNVRELQNAIERALILGAGERVIRPMHFLPPEAGLSNRAAAQ